MAHQCDVHHLPGAIEPVPELKAPVVDVRDVHPTLPPLSAGTFRAEVWWQHCYITFTRGTRAPLCCRCSTRYLLTFDVTCCAITDSIPGILSSGVNAV